MVTEANLLLADEEMVLAAGTRGGAGWRRLWSELRRSAKGLTGAIIVAVAIVAAVAAPVVAPYSPTDQVVLDKFAPPSLAHPFGADNLGRDILSRTIYGGRVSLAIGLMVVAIAATVGSILGGIAGYWGGFLDTLIMRLVDFQLSFPFILLAMIFLAILGPGFWSVLVALSVALWVNYARLVRGESLKLRELEFVQAAQTIGVSKRRIVFSHILPNVLQSILVLATLDMAFVIIFESSLTFLGLGIQPPTASWGIMLSDGRNYLQESPWMSVFPGAAIILVVVGINLLGDWLRDVLDPSLQVR